LTDEEKKDASRIPLFSEVLDMLNDKTGLIVEIKQDSDEMIEKIFDLLHKHGRTTAGTTCWFSLKKKVNKKLQRFEKNALKLPTISSVPEVLGIFILYWLGLLPFFPLKNTFKILGVICLRVDTDLLHRLVKIPRPIAACLNFFVGGKPSKILVVPNLIRHMKARGFPCVVLGMNEVEDIHFVKTVMATGALTDHCKTIKQSHEWAEMVNLWAKEAGRQDYEGIGAKDVNIDLS